VKIESSELIVRKYYNYLLICQIKVNILENDNKIQQIEMNIQIILLLLSFPYRFLINYNLIFFNIFFFIKIHMFIIVVRFTFF